MPMTSHAFEEQAFGADIIACLHSANRNALFDLANTLPGKERAELAALCWRRTHFHDVGLALAAQCDRQQLVAYLGSVIGETLFAQSRSQTHEFSRAPTSSRSKITLARGSATKRIVDADPDVEPSESSDQIATAERQLATA
jgi:hypothetical protein